ncbi:MAG: TolC family protein [Sphingobacteriales bacterium]|nr:MAG: TolC family protein [Sphingobacteriales bacterium]
MKVCIACIFLFFALQAASQVTPRTGSDSLGAELRPDSIIEKLVAMAYENSRLRAVENTTLSAEYEWRRSKTAILNNITIAGNVNEVSLKQSSASTDPLKQSTQYPRYNVGVVLPLGIFINNGKTTKANYHRYEAMVDQVNIEKQNIRREIQVGYDNYTLNKQLLILQDEVLSDAELLRKSQEERFRNEEISLEAYLASNKAFNNERVKRLNLQHEVTVTAAQLEQLIGMRIEDALRQMRAEGVRR